VHFENELLFVPSVLNDVDLLLDLVLTLSLVYKFSNLFGILEELKLDEI
jgi:hypothetical protein